MLTKIAQLFLLGVLPYVLIGVVVPDVPSRDDADRVQEQAADAPDSGDERENDVG